MLNPIKPFIKNTLPILSTVTLAALTTVSVHAEERNFDLEKFSSLDVAQGIIVTMTIGDQQSITASSRDGEMDRLNISVKNDTLIIRRKKKKSWGWGSDNGDFRVEIIGLALNNLDASSGSSVSVEKIASQAFSVDASSGASITVSGTCTKINADASSGSSINAGNLVCKNGVADVSSGASIKLHASESFNGDASSGGSVNVYGSPQDYTTDKSSGGSISIR